MKTGLWIKNPIRIEAVQLTNDLFELEEIADWCGGILVPNKGGRPEIVIPTLEGDLTATCPDWIIKGVEGEFYPCKDSIFKLTYSKSGFDIVTYSKMLRIWYSLTKKQNTKYLFNLNSN